MKIKNRKELLSHGSVESKKILLDITEKTLCELDAYERIKSITSLDGDILRIGTKAWDLSKKRHVYLFGAGKACNHMARAIDEILGDKLTKGIAIVKIMEETDVFRNTELYIGGHPLPNEDGYRACLEMLKIVDNATPDDLFILVISGGSSALMSCPIPGISLQDEIDATDILLKSGANIYEINAIRRHISQMNGGMLAKRIQQRGAELIGFGISDAVGNPPTTDIRNPYPNYKGTPMGPDQTTLETAQNTIQNYHLADRLPASVVSHIMHCGPESETPKEFPDNTYFMLNTLPDSAFIAEKYAAKMGLNSMILTTFLEGESKDAGTIMASLARQIYNYGTPIQAPCLIISSGETTTRIPDNSIIKGHGGPSQELTVSFAISATAVPGAAMLSIDSEGTDGTTPAAGGLTDSSSYSAAAAKGIDLYDSLRSHACYEALSGIGDAILTGNTGTNLCDFNLLYIPAKDESR